MFFWKVLKGKLRRSSLAAMPTAEEIYRPQTSSIVTQPFIDHCCRLYALDHSGDHGYAHWMRVLYNGRMLAQATGANLKVVELFALLHDTHRRNELSDPGHGLRAAKYTKRYLSGTLEGYNFGLDESEIDTLCFAIAKHTGSNPEEAPNITVAVCWDADRLDLARVGKVPDPDKLCTELARSPTTIQQASARTNYSL